MSKKNLSPKQIALVVSFPAAIVSAIVILLLGAGWIYALSVFILLSLTIYWIAYVMINRYLDKKIKIIYKLISQTKLTKKEDFYYRYLLPEKSLEEVSAEVKQWATQHDREIDELRKNEIFRKEFLLNLSHELKTPIFAAQSYIETLSDGALYNPEVNKGFLEKASKNIYRLVRLVEDLDEITRLESGSQILNKQHFVIQDLIKDVFESLSIKADQKNIGYFIKKGCESSLYVFADREKIRQVITNLVENAIKYSKKDGIIEGSAYKIEGEKILIEISDNGLGIGEEHLSRIFERFYRIDSARSHKVGGSGLGLSIAKHIIEAHEETIHVRSKIDVGSTFGITLPKGKSAS